MVEYLTGFVRISRLAASETWTGSKWKALAPWGGGLGESGGCDGGASGSCGWAESAGGKERLTVWVVSQGQARVSVIS